MPAINDHKKYLWEYLVEALSALFGLPTPNPQHYCTTPSFVAFCCSIRLIYDRGQRILTIWFELEASISINEDSVSLHMYGCMSVYMSVPDPDDNEELTVNRQRLY